VVVRKGLTVHGEGEHYLPFWVEKLLCRVTFDVVVKPRYRRGCPQGVEDHVCGLGPDLYPFYDLLESKASPPDILDRPTFYAVKVRDLGDVGKDLRSL